MKTNITNLINLVAEDERKLNVLSRQLSEYAYTITTKELDGRENIIEDCKAEFDEVFKQCNELTERISKMKKIIYQKNNELKLPNGESIQDALVNLNILRKKLVVYNNLSSYKSSNRRITEVNNSYFECRNLNFDMKELKNEIDKLNEEIQQIEFEISKLNSIEFEINV